MEKRQILNDYHHSLDDREIWYDTKDPNFIEISMRSRVRHSWLSYQPVLASKYANSPIKPTSGYVANIGYEPSLVDISGNQVTIRNYLYADMYLLKDDTQDLGFYHIDRPWMRQYYLTSEVIPDNDYCFNGTFKFFVPWFLDDNVEVTYLNVAESPFLVQGKTDFWFKPHSGHEFVNPHMVAFKFKKIGKHMEDNELGIPRRGDPMFDMQFRVSDIMLERIKEYYANN